MLFARFYKRFYKFKTEFLIITKVIEHHFLNLFFSFYINNIEFKLSS